MYETRTITDTIGHVVLLSVDPNGQLGIARTDVDKEQVIVLTKRDAHILHAFLQRAAAMGKAPHPGEVLGNMMHLDLVTEPPMVVLKNETATIELHAPGWSAVACEIGLLLPRLDELS